MQFILDRLTLSRRLMAGFGLVLSLLLAITWLALQGMQRMDANVGEIVEVHDLRISQAQAMLNAINEMSVAVLSVRGEADEEDVKYYIGEMGGAIGRYDAAYKDFSALLGETQADAAASEQLKKVSVASANARSMIDSLRKMADSNPSGMPNALNAINPRKGQDAWLKEVVVQVAIEAAAAQQSYAEARASYITARMLLIGATLVASCVGLLAGAMILRSVTQPLKDAIGHARRIAAGDLSGRIESARRDETGVLLQALGQMQEQLRGIVGSIRTATDGITTASSEIAQGNMDLSIRTEQTASGLQQAAISMDQWTGTVRKSGASAQVAQELAMAASDVAQKGGRVVSEVVCTMGSINDSSKKIADIIGVIDGIAFQTNILALNAAVEAARAGKQGRGFAVVASEVRSLAQRSAEAAKEIKTLIVNSVDKVDMGARLVQSAGDTMREIVTSVLRVNEVIAEITSAASRQNEDIAQVAHTVGELDRVTQQNAALVEQSAASAASLHDDAQRLAQAVSAFRFDAALGHECRSN
jgi:methyl-accepting chemotaxis protein